MALLYADILRMKEGMCLCIRKKCAYLDVFCANVNATDECAHLIDGPRVDFIGLGLTSSLAVHGQ